MPVDDLQPKARVTIVVTQRERESLMQVALADLYENTGTPFDLVYVSGRLSARHRRRLRGEADRRGFTHVEAGRRLTPAEARNIGLAHATTEFIQFVENDVVFKPGWLDALIACADETGADVVAPLTCEGRPFHTILHHVGMRPANREFYDEAAAGARDFKEEFYLQGMTLDSVADQLVRRRTQSCEFHCVLVRRSVFEKTGLFDPNITSKEYLDFSWEVLRAGGEIWLEPKAVVTFLVPSHDDPVKPIDLPYFLLRWSGEWQQRSHEALKAKWGLCETGFISKRRRLADWRIVDHVVKPVLEKAPLVGRRWGFVQRGAKLAFPLLSIWSSALVWRYDRDSRGSC